MGVSFNFVTERIAVGGGISCKADVDQLVAGITHVIDMCANFDDHAPSPSNAEAAPRGRGDEQKCVAKMQEQKESVGRGRPVGARPDLGPWITPHLLHLVHATVTSGLK